jgi:hypothetical protein
MANIVQQTNIFSAGSTTLTCPAFGSAVTANDAIVLVAEYNNPTALAISSAPTVGDGTANIYNLALLLASSNHIFNVTFTATPSGTAGTLTADFTGGTGGSYLIAFSDGELRQGSFTGPGTSTAVTWTTAITGTPSVNAIVYNPSTLFAAWYAPNSAAGTVTPALSSNKTSAINSLYAAEITNVGTGAILLGAIGNVQAGPGTSPNAINSGTITVNQNAVLFGFCCDTSTVTTPRISGGTGFVAQAAVWNNGTSVTALAEDATINSSSAATFTAIASADTYYSIGMALAGPGPFTPFTQTQFFVTDTIIQQ